MGSFDRAGRLSWPLNIAKWIAVALAVLAFVAYCSASSLSSINVEASVRYMVHATIVDGEDVYEGSAIWEMHILQARAFSHDMVTSVRGEGIQMRGSGPRNFFLLRASIKGGSSPSFGNYPLQCISGQPRTNVELIENIEEMFSGTCEVLKLPPLLVEIPDLGDPSSIEKVAYSFTPSGQCGGGTCLTSLWIERTTKPINSEITKTLPWLKRYTEESTNVVTGHIENTNGTPITYKLMDFTRGIEGTK